VGDDRADDRADLDLLKEPTRRAIVSVLAERPRRASSIADALGTSRAAASRHLRLLRDGGIPWSSGSFGSRAASRRWSIRTPSRAADGAGTAFRSRDRPTAKANRATIGSWQ
jgi:predicted transcriptional regulator